jgi:PadR family transcriptional regulator AphA
MSLKHALLAILTADSMSGYDLIKYFDGSVTFVWSAPHSQIYPELRRLDSEGLVEVEEVARGKKGTKRIYSINEEGIEEFRRWVNELLPLQPERDPYRLKAAFMEWAEPENARRQLQEHKRHYEASLLRWQQLVDDIGARRVPLLQRRLERRDPREHDRIVAFKEFAFRGEVARAKAEIAWAEEGLRLLDELEAQPPKRRSARRARA